MGSCMATFMLERTDIFCGCAILISNLALNAGSSKQGKAALAEVGSNWVAPSCLKMNYLIW